MSERHVYQYGSDPKHRFLLTEDEANSVNKTLVLKYNPLTRSAWVNYWNDNFKLYDEMAAFLNEYSDATGPIPWDQDTHPEPLTRIN